MTIKCEFSIINQALFCARKNAFLGLREREIHSTKLLELSFIKRKELNEVKDKEKNAFIEIIILFFWGSE